MYRKTIIPVGIVIVFVALVASANANLIENGGFEADNNAAGSASSGSFTFYAPGDTMPGGWVVGLSNAYTFGNPYWGTYAAEGDNFAATGPGGQQETTLAQSFATDIGGTYLLSFYATDGSDTLGVGFDVTVGDLVTSVMTPASSTGWELYELSFTATDTTSTLTFHNNIGDATNIDDVVVEVLGKQVLVAESDGSTELDENNTLSDTLTVSLSVQPTSSVTVTLDPDRSTKDFKLNAEAAGDSLDLIFTAANWDTAQMVTITPVTGDADSVYREHGDILISSTSGDADYNLGTFNLVKFKIMDTDQTADDSGLLQSSTWVATDALGRQLPTYEQVGPPQSNKDVALFYFLWLGEHGQSGPYDLTDIVTANPANPSFGPIPAFHHWGESEFGYYVSSEKYVMRKHVQMFNDAGVDVLVFVKGKILEHRIRVLVLADTLRVRARIIL